MTSRKPGPLAAIRETVLLDPQGEKHKAADLWTQQPVLFLCIKRPGCVLCRAHARRLWSVKSTFDELGVKLVCLVHTWVPGEVAAFSPDNWGGDIFLDRDKAIYRAIGEGKVRKQPLWKVVANFCTIKGRIRSLQKQAPDIGRMRDLGFPGMNVTMGGVMIVKSGSQGIQYMFTEDFFGDVPTIEEVVHNCEAASGKTATIDYRSLVSMRKCSSDRCK